MIKKLINLFFFLLTLTFFYYVISMYFSEENMSKINKNRSDLKENLNKSSNNLPLLDSDTQNIIDYNFDQNQIKIKKRNFWDLIKTNE